MRICGGRCFCKRVAACLIQKICPERTAEMVAPSRPVQVVEGLCSVPIILLQKSHSTDIDNNEGKVPLRNLVVQNSSNR